MRSTCLFIAALALLGSAITAGCKKGMLGGGSDADNALVQAAMSGDVEAAKKAISQGANVNYRAAGSAQMGDEGHSPLHYAAERNHTEMVTFLLDKGANIEARNAMGNTPLLLAVNFTMTDTVKLLLKRGANINVRNNNGAGVIAHAKKGRPSKRTLELLAIVEQAGATP